MYLKFQTLLVVVRCLLNELCAKQFISQRQCDDFIRDACHTADVVRQISDKNCRLQVEVATCMHLLGVVYGDTRGTGTYPSFWTEGYRTPHFSGRKCEEFALTCTVSRGDLRR